MSFLLTNTHYQKAEGGTQLVQGIKGGRIPRNAIRGGFGTFVVYGEPIPARFYMYFKNTENGKEYCYNAYPRIKECMVSDRLTEKRRTNIALEVADIAADSEEYNPDKWIATAVKRLKI